MDSNIKIKVVGIGGAGGNTISRLSKYKIEGVDLIIINTDSQDLKKVKADFKIQIGNKITKNAEEMENELRKAKSAKDQGNAKITALSANQAARLVDSNKRLGELKERLDKLYNLLFRIRENSDYVLQDTINEVNLQKDEYLAYKEGHSALKAGMKILKGDPDKLEIYEASLQLLADNVSQKIGEINYYMDISTDVMNTIDIENNVLTSKGFELLEKLEKNNKLPDTVTKRDKVDTKLDSSSKWDSFL